MMENRVCKTCHHFRDQPQQSEAEPPSGLCKAGPPTAMLMIKQEQNLLAQRIDMIPHIVSGWPPVAAHEECGGWTERRQ